MGVANEEEEGLSLHKSRDRRENDVDGIFLLELRDESIFKFVHVDALGLRVIALVDDEDATREIFHDRDERVLFPLGHCDRPVA